MVFAAAGGRKSVLRELSRLLIAAFPGCTIYENLDYPEMLACVKSHRNLDAVFVDGEWDEKYGFRLLETLHAEHGDLPVYVFSDDDRLEGDAFWNDAAGYLVRPVSAEQLRCALHTIIKEKIE